MNPPGLCAALRPVKARKLWAQSSGAVSTPGKASYSESTSELGSKCSLNQAKSWSQAPVTDLVMGSRLVSDDRGEYNLNGLQDNGRCLPQGDDGFDNQTHAESPP